MAAGAAAAATATTMDHASSSCCSCCFCRHSCCGGGAGLSEDKARLAAALIAAHSDRTTAVASLVLFAASVGVILAKLGSSSLKARPLDRARGQMHSFHARRRGTSYNHVGYKDRRDRFFIKRSRKSRWEWRPVTRRSTASQTAPLDPAFVASLLPSPSPGPMAVEEPNIASPDEFPGLSRKVVDARPQTPRSSEDVKDLVATGLKLAPLPMVELLRTDYTSCSNLVGADLAEEQQHTLNRKQRKHLKKKQKKLVAASRTLQISSLPILKSWKSSSSPPPPTPNKLNATTPCKIDDCSNKSFGPLGSSSSKSIAWTFSSKLSPNFAASTSSTGISTVPASQDQQPSTSGVKFVPEVSEISESPKSYLEDWTDNESFKRSHSDPEEIEIDVPSLDFEFEEDSEDYSFQPTTSILSQ